MTASHLCVSDNLQRSFTIQDVIWDDDSSGPTNNVLDGSAHRCHLINTVEQSVLGDGVDCCRC